MYNQVNNYDIIYKMMDYNTTMRHNKIYIYLSHSQKNMNEAYNQFDSYIH